MLKRICVSLLVLLHCTGNLIALDGQLLNSRIDAPSLKGNLLGDGVKRTIVIYLPPSYKTSTLHYPVVYFLPGYGTTASDLSSRISNAIDRQIALGVAKEMIVVIADSRNVFAGGFYANSPVTGNWEDFIVQDVVGYVDANYRTLKSPASRAISGHSMGGTGCIHLAMRHPDVFGHLYSLSPGLYDTNGVENQGMFSNEFVNNMLDREEVWAAMSDEDALADFLYKVPRLTTEDEMFAYAYAVTFSPNPHKRVPYYDYPYTREGTTLVLNEEILKNYESGFGGFEEKITTYFDAFNSLTTFVIDCGEKDEYSWIPEGCYYVSDLLTNAGITHELFMHNGNHFSQFTRRIKDYMFPIFSDNFTYDEQTSVETESGQLSKNMNLYNYPNPFNASTTIQFSLVEAGNVELKIYNLLGQCQNVLVQDKYEPGYYRIQYHADHLPSGIYYYQLQTVGAVLTNQMILLR